MGGFYFHVAFRYFRGVVGRIPDIVWYDLSVTLSKGCVPRPYPTQAATFPLSKIGDAKGFGRSAHHARKTIHPKERNTVLRKIPIGGP